MPDLHLSRLEIEKHDGAAPMTPDQERWGEALAVLKMHGRGAEAFIDGRMRELRDDPAGRARWRQILDRVKQVRKAPTRSNSPD